VLDQKIKTSKPNPTVSKIPLTVHLLSLGKLFTLFHPEDQISFARLFFFITTSLEAALKRSESIREQSVTSGN
jgi:hypothetical protein